MGGNTSQREWTQKFIDQVGIKRNEGETCEYEVCKKAMDLYKKYKCYNEWKPIAFQNSLNVYYRNSEKIGEEFKKDKCESEHEDKGPHLLVNKSKNIALTADILTSIKYPFTSLIFEDKSLNGEGLSNLFRDMDIHNYSKKMKSLYPYMKAFAKVYYWCGNMMPVICNFKGKYNDECIRKLEEIKKGFEEGYKCEEGSEYNLFIEGKIEKMNSLHVVNGKVWSDWANKSWENWKSFVSGNFFDDYVESDGSIRNIKLFCEAKRDDEKRDWLIINTKLIIQRSYRIAKPFHGEWDAVHKEEVQQIFKTVFTQVGLDYENNTDLQELF